MSLTNLGVNADTDANLPVAISADQVRFEFDTNSNVWRLTWSRDAFAATATSLADGYYRLELNADLFTDVAGNRLDGNGDGAGGDNYVIEFHRLEGDANGDRAVNSIDMNLINAALGAVPTSTTWNANADLDRDGRVTVRDRLIVARNDGHEIVPPAAPAPATIGVPGDFNGNGVVDAADYVIWRKNLGATRLVGPVPGDANSDLHVDGADYQVWRSNFGLDLASYGTSLGSGSAALAPSQPTAAPNTAKISEADNVGCHVELALVVTETLKNSIPLLARDEVFAATQVAADNHQSTVAERRLTQRRATPRIAVTDRSELLSLSLRAGQEPDETSDDDQWNPASPRRIRYSEHGLLEDSIDEALADATSIELAGFRRRPSVGPRL